VTQVTRVVRVQRSDALDWNATALASIRERSGAFERSGSGAFARSGAIATSGAIARSAAFARSGALANSGACTRSGVLSRRLSASSAASGDIDARGLFATMRSPAAAHSVALSTGRAADERRARGSRAPVNWPDDLSEDSPIAARVMLPPVVAAAGYAHGGDGSGRRGRSGGCFGLPCCGRAGGDSDDGVIGPEAAQSQRVWDPRKNRLKLRISIL
jgi:hypothetical protein